MSEELRKARAILSGGVTELGADTPSDEDKRSIGQLAQQAIDASEATNLSGIVIAWAKSIRRLRKLSAGADTVTINQHPINVLFADRVFQLVNGGDEGLIMRFVNALESCQRMVKEEKEELDRCVAEIGKYL